MRPSTQPGRLWTRPRVSILGGLPERTPFSTECHSATNNLTPPSYFPGRNTLNPGSFVNPRIGGTRSSQMTLRISSIFPKRTLLPPHACTVHFTDFYCPSLRQHPPSPTPPTD